MSRTSAASASAALVLGLLSTTPLAVAAAPMSSVSQAAPAQAAPAAGQVSAAEAAPFLGDWTLSMEGQNGPLPMNLTVKVDKDKVVGEISSEMQPLQAITDVKKTDKGLVLSYSFDYQGSPVPVVLMLTPAGDKMGANLDFAGGAFQMAGTATKKAK